jgi:hypothetical protein
MPVPNTDQRNMQELLSKAKRKVLLLQKGAATGHNQIGQKHTERGVSSVFISLSLTLMDGFVEVSWHLHSDTFDRKDLTLFIF